MEESPGREVRWRIQKFDSKTKTWVDIELPKLEEDFAVSIEFRVPESEGRSGRRRIEFETQPRGPKKKKPPPKRIEFETQPR